VLVATHEQPPLWRPASFFERPLMVFFLVR
jgi:hypothetical protein